MRSRNQHRFYKKAKTISNVAVQTIQAAESMTFSALGHVAAFALVASG